MTEPEPSHNPYKKPDVLVVGDGPAGLSAALFLAKNGMSVTVFGQDQTPMHKAMLYNYLGIPEMTGTRFQAVAQKQVADHGGMLINEAATAAEKTDTGFKITTDNSETYEAKYLVLTPGPNHEMAQSLGLSLNDEGGVDAERDGTTAVPNLYVAGWTTRAQQIQAIISAGDGAAAALSILSAEKGKAFHDFDVVG